MSLLRVIVPAFAAALVVGSVSAAFAQETEIKLPKSTWEAANFKDRKVGDFVEYEAETAGQKTVTRREVTAVGDHTVTETTTISGSFGKLPPTVVKYVFSEPDVKVEEKKVDAPKADVKKSEEKVKIGDKELACEVTETSAGGATTKLWTSKEVPFEGVVKSETKASGFTTTMVLKSYGRGK
jgi:hypothetical protein